MNSLIKKFNYLKAKKEVLAKDLNRKSKQLSLAKQDYDNLVKAKWVLTEVARLTQERFKTRVEELMTFAIQSVFDRPFEFKFIFEIKRNKLECKPVIYENSIEFDDPEYDIGGGLVDIISFAFRVVLWSLENPKSRAVFILDEPMKHIGKGELLIRAGKMLKEISSKLKFQLIIITHEPLLAEIADRKFEVSHNGRRSLVEEV